MNSFALNSKTLNGAVRALVLATVSIGVSAAVTVESVRQSSVSSFVNTEAVVTASAEVYRSASATVICAANVYPAAQLKQVAQASIRSEANVQAYVLRYIESSISFAGSSTIYAVVANVIGFSDIQATANIAAKATRVQAVKASLTTQGSLVVTIAPTVYRMVQANAVGGIAKFRIESGVNRIFDAYADIQPTVTITELNSLVRFAVSNVSVGSEITADATQSLPAYANIQPAEGMFIAAAGALYGATRCYFGASDIKITALATRIILADANVHSTSQVTAIAKQIFKAEVILAGSSKVAINTKVTQFAWAYADVTANATAAMDRYVFAEAKVTNSATILISEPTVVSILQYATCTFDPTLVIEISGDIYKPAYADLMNTASVLALAMSNVDSYDPDDRTFYRTRNENTFYSPARTTEFRRYA